MIELMILLVVIVTISAIFIHADLQSISDDVTKVLRELRRLE